MRACPSGTLPFLLAGMEAQYLMAYFWQQGPNCWGDWVSEMIYCYWLAHQQQCKSEEEKEGETLSVIWVSHHRQCSHFCGAESVGSKNQPWASRAWPPLWLTWEWQDYAILQANPFSNQLSQHHIWWKMWFGLDLRWVIALAYSTDRIWLRFPPNSQHRRGGALMLGPVAWRGLVMCASHVWLSCAVCRVGHKCA